MTKTWPSLIALLILIIQFLLGALPGAGQNVTSGIEPGTPTPHFQTASRTTWRQEATWFQELIFLYASGTPQIQQASYVAEADAGLPQADLEPIGRVVRTAWLQLMAADPASLGRIGTTPNSAAQERVLSALRAQLQRITGPQYSAWLSSTDRIFAQTASRLAATMSGPVASGGGASLGTPGNPGGEPRPANLFVQVYATSFSIPNTPATAQYVALPDAYLKYANLGETSVIPTLYQPYYVPAAGSGQPGPTFTIDVGTTAGNFAATNVPIQDVGPWNEDDNWWDPVYTGVQVPAGCPVSPTLVSSSSLANPQVDGICPSTRVWRRTAYYVLYQHAGLPFFQPTYYAPTGPYADATNWPPVMGLGCPEASLASSNQQGAPCGSIGYNGKNGAWLRDGTYQAPILNQSGVDLSPAVDAALGWQYPSSGVVELNVARLP